MPVRAASRRCRPALTAPSITRSTSPTTSRSPSIWTITVTRATWVAGVMSPNPTVEKTVTVK